MIISLKKVSESPLRFDFNLDQDWWAQETSESSDIVGLPEPLRVTGEVSRAGNGYLLSGRLQGVLLLRCARCMANFRSDFKHEFDLFLAHRQENNDQSEVELSKQDLDTNFIRGAEIEMEQIIKEQIYLGLPMVTVCSPECSGLCPQCGGNLNRRSCSCGKTSGHPAFAKLKALKNDKK